MQWHSIQQQIQDQVGNAFEVEHARAISGGCINQGYCLSGRGQTYFVKLNAAHRVDMFAAEAAGLQALAAANAIRVPQPICWGAAESAYLVLEYMPLSSQGEQSSLGEAIAALHQVTQAQFGWHRHNTLGLTPQHNTPCDDWVTFYAQSRLQPQLALAADNGGAAVGERGARLVEHLAAFFTDYQPQPSLLHGDLWSGNYAFDEQARPVIYDPAVYFGDREADIAMTTLFGGFSAAFYAGYAAVYPLDPGYETRKTLYNLYHILNHYNLFGGGYLAQAGRMIDQLLSTIK